MTNVAVAVSAGVGSGGVGGQPGSQVGRALEVEQGVRQGFQLFHRQGPDLGGGGFAEGAAAAVEEAKGDRCFAVLPAFGFAFLAAFGFALLEPL